MKSFTAAALLLAAMACNASAAPLQTFKIAEPLSHQWNDEVVHFDFDVPNGRQPLVLTDAAHKPLLRQYTDLKIDNKGKHTSGQVWTVVSLAPGASATFNLERPAKATAPASDLAIEKSDTTLVLRNGQVQVQVPLYGALPATRALTAMQAPMLAVRSPQGQWLGAGHWFDDGTAPQVRAAKTSIIESGPVRATVREELTFEGGTYYRADIQLGARQDAAIISESSSADVPGAGWKFSMAAGLKANHIFWHNQWKSTSHAASWALADTALTFQKDDTVANLRPWSFWWLGDITIWAGFYQQGAPELVGVMALHPSRWSPMGWDGFDRTQIPITAHKGGEVDMTFALLANAEKPGGKPAAAPLHREWAITVGTTAEHLIDPKSIDPNGPQRTAKLRRQLIKYSEFPLDTVKDYGFDFTPTKVAAVHPFLALSAADITRVRLQAKTNPAVKAKLAAAITYVNNTHAANTLEKEGPRAFYTKNYVGNYLIEKLPEAYIGSDDPVYGKLLAAAVQNLCTEVMNTFLEAPAKPAIGSYGPWFTENIDRLVYNYDLIAGKGLLSPEEERIVRNTLVFSAHFLAHPDYWNPEHGLASANPNMTSSIRLPRGLLGLMLAGHPEAPGWLREAEAELQDELKNWVSPGGAWIENPGYQSASLDGMFLLAQGLRNTGGHNYFADPQFKATMDYYGYLLTPPDRRFPPALASASNVPTQKIPGVPHPMTLPAFGDGFAGMVNPFNGWMAKATAADDPAYSRRQQWFWQVQNYYFGGAGRAKGMTMGLTDTSLPAEPPTELSRGFPGFGSLMRSSWTEPKAFYVAHRTGPNLHHYHYDFNSFVLYAKGAPLCLDFGNDYQPVQRNESIYHNMVSFGAPGTPGTVGTGHLVATQSLPAMLEYSHGVSDGGGGQHDNRHLLMVESADPMGANYLVVRDHTTDGQPNQQFSYNLWCLSKEPQINGNVVHFPGQFDVDLDVHLLSPAQPKITTDHWGWSEQIYVWGQFEEEQYGIHVAKSGSHEDFLSVLNPRGTGQAAADITALVGGAALKVHHSEGDDLVLLSPDATSTAADNGLQVSGKIALARRYTDGRLRLATVSGASQAAAAGFVLASDGAAAVDIKPDGIEGLSSGQAHNATLTLPAAYGTVAVKIDGAAVKVNRAGDGITLSLPAGYHTFSLVRTP